MKSRVIAATTPGRASGRTMVRTVLSVSRPQIHAASSSSRWICISEVESAFTVSGRKRAMKASARIQMVP